MTLLPHTMIYAAFVKMEILAFSRRDALFCGHTNAYITLIYIYTVQEYFSLGINLLTFYKQLAHNA